MPDHGHGHHGPPDTSKGYEQSDLEFGSIGKGVAFYFIFTALIGVVVYVGFLVFHQADVPSQALSSVPSAPYPVLQNNITARTDIWNLRAREDFLMHTYTYVDSSKKAVREPVDQALDEVAVTGPSGLKAAPEAPKEAPAITIPDNGPKPSRVDQDIVRPRIKKPMPATLQGSLKINKDKEEQP